MHPLLPKTNIVNELPEEPTKRPAFPGVEMRGITYAEGSMAAEILLALAENNCEAGRCSSHEDLNCTSHVV